MCKEFLTSLQNLVELPRSTSWARLAVNAFCVKAIQLHMHQQQLHHLGHRVGFIGEDTHLHPKVKGAWYAVILSNRKTRSAYMWWTGILERLFVLRVLKHYSICISICQFLPVWHTVLSNLWWFLSGISCDILTCKLKTEEKRRFTMVSL